VIKMLLLSSDNLKAYYVLKEGTIRAVNGVSMEIDHEVIYGLIGESGCGKSTLANVLMMRIIPPLKFMGGSLLLNGEDLFKASDEYLRTRVWGKMVSMIPQSALSALNPTERVRDLIKYVLKTHNKALTDTEITEIARKRFEELNLPTDALNFYPHELSGGMRQRVTIAISTLLNPDLLIVDEPTSALDVSTQKVVLKLLKRLRDSKIVESILFVTHDIAVLRQIADQIAVMYAGKIVEMGQMEQVMQDPRHPYTKALVNSVLTPEPEIRKRGLTYIPGEPPDLSNPPPGCKFHPRCQHASEVCRAEEPTLRALGNGRYSACFLNESTTEV